MRHLYAVSSEPGISYLIDKAKTFERRRCNHLPEDYPEPLSAKDCLASVVDPKDSKTNKHRYVVASQDLEVRKHMRGVLGVPLVYVSRSVMIMEPMADGSREGRERGERGKFREGIKARESGSLKRKRDDDETGEAGGQKDGEAKKKRKGAKGPKGPNPLSVKKPKKKAVVVDSVAPAEKKEKREVDGGMATQSQGEADGSDPTVKRKRKRKHKSAIAGEGAVVAEEAAADD
jgi:U3 small nucleolar RNA-associated protein 23